MGLAVGDDHKPYVRERRVSRKLQVYFGALDPADFDRVLADVEMMDHVQLLRLHCKLSAALQIVAALQAAVEEAPESGRLDTSRPPSSLPPEGVEVE